MNSNNNTALVVDSDSNSRLPACDPYEVWRRTIRDDDNSEADHTREDSADPYQVWRHLIRS